MVRHSRARRSDCPIGFTLDIFGDRWSLLILRDVLTRAKSRFREFAAEERIATNVLAERLERLEGAGLLTRANDPSDARQFVYRPTRAAIDLLPVVVEMAYWGAMHDPETGAPREFVEAYEADRQALLAGMRAALTAGS
ncbi:MAG: helix-turn-helix transcriptional regulator [Rhizobiaceae bacterium]|nr:helix-turn-helix transcriptional regulator [Rhizobiaceae bacterium]